MPAKCGNVVFDDKYIASHITRTKYKRPENCKDAHLNGTTENSDTCPMMKRFVKCDIVTDMSVLQSWYYFLLLNA